MDADAGQAALQQLRALAKAGTVTLVYAAKDTEHNEAVILVDLLNQA